MNVHNAAPLFFSCDRLHWMLQHLAHKSFIPLLQKLCIITMIKTTDDDDGGGGHSAPSSET